MNWINRLFPSINARRQAEVKRRLCAERDLQRLLTWPPVPKYDGPDLMAEIQAFDSRA